MLREGTVIGAYVVEAALPSSGGMATVYRVRHTALRSVHALKVLHPHLAADETIQARFLEEGRIQARLQHPGVLAVTDVVNQDGVAGLVMSWLDGVDLRTRMVRGPVPLDDALRWCCAILDTLRAVHAQGVVHRDIKPSNIFLRGPEEQPVLIDFGIAKVADLRRTQTGKMLGTLGYMSPEQIQDPASIDHRTDLFAVGCVLYELASGRRAFDGGSEAQVLLAVVQGQSTPIREVSPDIPDTLAEIIHRALSTDPDDRFSDAAAFLAALQAVDTTPEPEELLPPIGAGAGTERVPEPTPAPATAEAPKPQWGLRLLLGCGLSMLALVFVCVGGWTLGGLLVDDGSPTTSRRRLAEVPPAPADPAAGAQWEVPRYPMRWVPAGRFTMGSEATEELRDRDEDAHPVTLRSGLWLGQHEVTQGLWEAVMGENPVADPDYREHQGLSLVGEQNPVMVITWCQAVHFANQMSLAYGLEPAYHLPETDPADLKREGCLAYAQEVSWDRTASGFRLPTEAEWEYAARAGTTARFGETRQRRAVCQHGNVSTAESKVRFGWGFEVFPCEDGHVGLAPVGSYAANAWGLHDMIGNAWEWCWDWKRDYPDPPRALIDPSGAETGTYRISRGGSWEEAWRYSRLANRAYWHPGDKGEFIGIRLALPAQR